MPDWDNDLEAWVPWDPDHAAWQAQRGTDWITALALTGLFLLVVATVGAAIWLMIIR